MLNFQVKKFAKTPSCALFIDLERIDDVFLAIGNLPKKSLIIVRQYHLLKQEREKFAREIINFSKKFGHKILIGKDVDLALKLRAHGVHFSDRDSDSWKFIKKKFARKNFMISFACHDLRSVFKAQNSQAEILFLSPIFHTKSHENAVALGLMDLARGSFNSQKKIFALGGIGIGEVKMVKKAGAQGFGGIEVFKK